MRLLDFIKPRKPSAQQPATPVPNDLIFKSAKDAFGYVQQYMKTEWKPDSVVVALVAHPILEKGILSARVLIPKDDQCVELPTLTTVRAEEQGRVPVDSSSDISILGLKFGDLVTVLFAARDAEFARLVPESDGWVAFIIGRNLPIYSLRDGGWRIEKRYEL
jgi:hypothetical protein